MAAASLRAHLFCVPTLPDDRPRPGEGQGRLPESIGWTGGPNRADVVGQMRCPSGDPLGQPVSGRPQRGEWSVNGQRPATWRFLARSSTKFEVRQVVHRAPRSVLEEVSVEVHRHGAGGMPEQALDGLDIRPGRDEEGRGRVTVMRNSA